MHDNSDHDHSDNSFDGFTIDEIKDNFGALAEELEKKGSKSMKDVIDNAENSETEFTPPPFFRGYIPTIRDYLERATTRDECREIIEYCLKKGEISHQEAEKYLYRLEKGGPRAFGTRQPGYYDKKL